MRVAVQGAVRVSILPSAMDVSPVGAPLRSPDIMPVSPAQWKPQEAGGELHTRGLT